MSNTFTYTFDTPLYKGTTTLNTGLFINGEWVQPIEEATADVYNPATGKIITKVSVGGKGDVDLAVIAAQKAYKTNWGLKCPGATRGKLLNKLADLIEANTDEFAALESLNTGKVWFIAKVVDVALAISVCRYFAGWADKISGKTNETTEDKLTYTRREPYGVTGAIVPWNLPLAMLAFKVAPAVATGNTIVLKPSEITPLTALRFASLINEAGFPPGVVNIINGYGDTVGQSIIEHPDITKISFTGSTSVGRKVMKASSETNLKHMTLELGGKNPTVIFDDADLDQAVKWASRGIFFNKGEACIAGSRIFVQEGIYDLFLSKFTETAKALEAATGDPFSPDTQHGPQVSQVHFDRIMRYIESGKKEGATVHFGGERHGQEGYFIQPTIFTDTNPGMKIIQEEIFGPVATLIKFKTEEEVVEAANDTVYGLTCSIFSENISRAIRVAHAAEAGTVWINCAQSGEVSIPIAGYKLSGMGSELGESAIDSYTQLKAVHVNLSIKL